MSLNKVWSLVLLVLSLWLAPLQLSAKPDPVTAEKLFDAMEKRSEKIDALMARVELGNQHVSKIVTLSIKNPDKFAIEFDDGSVMVFFNGKNLWIYVKSINEVFYHFAESQGFMASYFNWFSPRKLFTSLTRKTLFSLFDVALFKTETVSNEETCYWLKFTPKMKTVFKTVFAVGHYHMMFSTVNYLPCEVVEFSQNGLERGRLKVLVYKLNELLPDSYFDYNPPESAVMVPISVVIAQKIEQSAALFADRIKEAAGKIKDYIWNWSF